jgi:hypothetical protein
VKPQAGLPVASGLDLIAFVPLFRHNFVTARFGAKGSDLTAEQVVKLRSED